MKTFHSRRGQEGITLVMALMMVVLLSLVVVSAFNMTNTNLRSVGNMQWRDESIAAANRVVEQVISTPFYNATSAQPFTVDINKDGVNDYTVSVAAPTCIRAVQAAEASPSDVELSADLSSGAFWNTDWDVQATVTDAVSGTSVVIRQGVRVKLSATDKTSKCA